MGCDYDSCQNYAGKGAFGGFFLASSITYAIVCAIIIYIIVRLRPAPSSRIPMLFILASLSSRALWLGFMYQSITSGGGDHAHEWTAMGLFKITLSRFSWLCMFTALTFVARTWHMAITLPAQQNRAQASSRSWRRFYLLNMFVWAAVLVTTIVLYYHTNKGTAQLNYIVVAYSFFMLGALLLTFSVMLARRVPNPGKIVGFTVDVVFFTFVKVVILAYTNFWCAHVPGLLDCIVYPFVLYDVSDIIPAVHLIWILRPRPTGDASDHLQLQDGGHQRVSATFIDRIKAGLDIQQIRKSLAVGHSLSQSSPSQVFSTSDEAQTQWSEDGSWVGNEVDALPSQPLVEYVADVGFDDFRLPTEVLRPSADLLNRPHEYVPLDGRESPYKAM